MKNYLNCITGSEIREFFVDQGQNLTLPCALKGDGEIMWVREGREDRQVERLTIQHDGSLFLQEVNRNDTGLYSCFVDDAHSDNETRSKVRVKVRSTFHSVPFNTYAWMNLVCGYTSRCFKH